MNRPSLMGLEGHALEFDVDTVFMLPTTSHPMWGAMEHAYWLYWTLALVYEPDFQPDFSVARKRKPASRGGTREAAQTAVRANFLKAARPGSDAVLDGLWGGDRRNAFRKWQTVFGNYGCDILHQMTECLLLVLSLRNGGKERACLKIADHRGRLRRVVGEGAARGR